MQKLPLQKTTLPDLIIKHIEDLLARGALKPGDKLPTERELMDLFAVGRTSVREALKALNALGLIERTREGTFIRENNSVFLSPMSKEIIMRRSSFKELFETRMVLEVALAGLAAERVTETELEEMQAILAAMEVLIEGEHGVFIDADITFHLALAEAAQNPMLYDIFAGVRDLVKDAQWKMVVVPGIKTRAYLEHLKIFEAIRAGDRRGAETAALEHLQLGLEYIHLVC